MKKELVIKVIIIQEFKVAFVAVKHQTHFRKNFCCESDTFNSTSGISLKSLKGFGVSFIISDRTFFVKDDQDAKYNYFTIPLTERNIKLLEDLKVAVREYNEYFSEENPTISDPKIICEEYK